MLTTHVSWNWPMSCRLKVRMRTALPYQRGRLPGEARRGMGELRQVNMLPILIYYSKNSLF